MRAGVRYLDIYWSMSTLIRAACILRVPRYTLFPANSFLRRRGTCIGPFKFHGLDQASAVDVGPVSFCY